MADYNFGRVQGAGFFNSSAASGTNIALASISPANIRPLAGDLVVFSNGDIRKVTVIEGNSVVCGEVLFNLKGQPGTPGASGTSGLYAHFLHVEWSFTNALSGGKAAFSAFVLSYISSAATSYDALVALLSGKDVAASGAVYYTLSEATAIITNVRIDGGDHLYYAGFSLADHTPLGYARLDSSTNESSHFTVADSVVALDNI